MSGKRDEYMRRAEELLRGTHWESELEELQASPPAGRTDSEDQRLMILLRSSEILNSIHSFEEVVPRLMDLVIRCLNAERGIIFLLEGENNFRPIAQANVEKACVDDAMEYSQSILRRAAEDHILWSGNAVGDARFSQYQSIAAFNIKSFLCVPIKRRGRIVGTIYVDNRSLENSFDKGDLEFLRTLANHAGVAIENARLHDRLQAENQELRSEIQQAFGGRMILGEHPKIREVLDVVARVAESDATVLVHGESGTGKELVARALHQNSARLGKPFVALNCAAIPENLLESELFGHTKGAFTGATANRAGKFEAAHQGTLFLDEIGDMSLPLQAKMLRVLQEGCVEPLGSNAVHPVDVRVVAATHHDLVRAVEENQFREDLFYRLNVIRIELPPLRERGDDVALLARHFLEKVRSSRTLVRDFSSDALDVLRAHSWPGNIRELENFVLRLSLLCGKEVADRNDVAPLLAGGLPGKGPAAPSPPAAHPEPATVPGVRPLEEIERRAILDALRQHEGNRTAAAQALGISVRKLQYKIKEYQQAGIADL